MTDAHDETRPVATPDPLRRNLVFGGGLAAGVALAGVAAQAQGTTGGRTSNGYDTLDGKPMPEPPADRSAGPGR